MARYLYSELSTLIDARKRCLADSISPANTPERSAHWCDMADEHETKIEKLVRDLMPSGSGFDSGTKLDIDASHAEKLVFTTSYHHMNDGGYYSGWTEHVVTVTPGFAGLHIRVSGRDRADIKEYICEVFDQALCSDCEFETWQYVFDCEIKPIWDASGCKLDAWRASVATQESRARGVTYCALDTEGILCGPASHEFRTSALARAAVVAWLKANREQAVKL